MENLIDEIESKLKTLSENIKILKDSQNVDLKYIYNSSDKSAKTDLNFEIIKNINIVADNCEKKTIRLLYMVSHQRDLQEILELVKKQQNLENK
jgi:hypothetical protein